MTAPAATASHGTGRWRARATAARISRRSVSLIISTPIGRSPVGVLCPQARQFVQRLHVFLRKLVGALRQQPIAFAAHGAGNMTAGPFVHGRAFILFRHVCLVSPLPSMLPTTSR